MSPNCSFAVVASAYAKCTNRRDSIQLAEFTYEQLFELWEAIWVASRITTAHFSLFVAVALLEVYRDTILENAFDFTDLIRFFNGILSSRLGNYEQLFTFSVALLWFFIFLRRLFLKIQYYNI